MQQATKLLPVILDFYRFIYNIYGKPTIMNLRVRAFALAAGTVFGLAIFSVTILYLVLNYQSDTLVKLNKVLFGYSITMQGSFIGLFWGLIYGALGGGIFAFLYNKFTKLFS